MAEQIHNPPDAIDIQGDLCFLLTIDLCIIFSNDLSFVIQL